MVRKKPKPRCEREKIEIVCEDCGKSRDVLLISAWRLERLNGGKHFCRSCKAKRTPKPQNKKSFWSAAKRKEHGRRVKQSAKYYRAIARRDQSGAKNGMYGRKLSKKSRKLMSIARTGKLGPNATAWKGGKFSLVRRVKKIMHTRYNWYARVYRRDKWRCVLCGAVKTSEVRLDAHHIVPVCILVKRLSHGRRFRSEETLLEFLVKQPEIVDAKLKNGMTLCRPCHNKIHKNWGSHNDP